MLERCSSSPIEACPQSGAALPIANGEADTPDLLLVSRRPARPSVEVLCTDGRPGSKLRLGAAVFLHSVIGLFLPARRERGDPPLRLALFDPVSPNQSGEIQSDRIVMSTSGRAMRFCLLLPQAGDAVV
jgi:hypothetical protein